MGWPGALWQENLQGLTGGFCVGTNSDGKEYACNILGECYIKIDSEWSKCGRGCAHSDKTLKPSNCEKSSGACNENYCQNGTTYGLLDGSGWGCMSQRNNGTYAYRPGGWDRHACYYKKEGETSFEKCGQECGSTHDCTECKQWFMAECAPMDACVLHERITNDCDCSKADGVESNGYCCPKGHVYHAGQCSIITVPEDKCYYGSHLIDETNDYKAPENGVACQCVTAGHCMGKNEYGVPFCATEFCSENSAG
jgi:hypothetical protein